MLARFLRQQSRPVRYAIHTQDMLPSLQFGLKSLARNHGVLKTHASMGESLGLNNAVMPGFEGHWNGYIRQHGRRDNEFLHDALSDLIGTGHPDALTAILHHAHNEMGVEPPGRWSHLHSGMPELMWHLHNMSNQMHAAVADPRHPLRQYNPEVLHDRFRAATLIPQVLDRELTPLRAHPVIQGLMPAAGGRGRGLAGLHDAYDLTRMGQGGPESHPDLHHVLGRLIRGLHDQLTQESGLNQQQLGTASLGG
jgi:hypothetical protein